ncbi:MAG: hypothetical protein FWH17_05175 [Oscillospiraceae bacterium]|nr:hypothetical protein [Oscillospiraceae bacterium]
MALIDDIKCARCDRKYSGVRSRCPYCGARRIGMGKYSKDSDNAKGKMLISILILSVFTVAAAIMLFTAPSDNSGVTPSPGIETSTPDLSEDGNISLPALDTPSPTPEPETPTPISVESVTIWVAPNQYRTQGFARTINPGSSIGGGSIDLHARVEPVGIAVDVTWSTGCDPDDPFFEISEVVGGIKLTPLKAGTASLTVTAGEKSETIYVEIRN